jgi:hypothetical protein
MEGEMNFHSWPSATYFCQIVEAILTCFILVVAFAVPHLGMRWFNRLEDMLTRLARRPRAATLGIVAGVISARLLLLPLLPIPDPSVHDEFSYLLAAKTFAAGRLTNSPDPFWRHFESVHILQQPTYMSMYAPGQGLVLALGLWATGKAWIGVLLSAGSLAGALFWALSGWFPRRWALAAAAVAAIRWLLVSYWMNSYWGGAVPALAGALIFGSLPRLVQKARIKDALLLGIGLIVLANTRPYEGLVTSAIATILLLVWSIRTGTVRRLSRPAVIVPVAGVLAVAAVGMMFYNARVTGSAFTLPYVEDRREYAIAPLFVWERIRSEPAYTTNSLRNVYAAEADLYRAARTNLGFPELFRKLKNFWIFFLGPLLSIPFIAFFLARKTKESTEDKRKRKYIGAILLAMLAAAVQVVWFYPHYFAPAFAPFVAMLLLGFRVLRRLHWRGRPVGVFLSRAIPIGCVLMASIPASAHKLGWRLSFWPLQWALGSPPEIHGSNVESSVLAEGKKALVFVEYGPNHDPGYEWVYNDPDINHSQIIWARELGPKSDVALISHFPDRSIWILKPDEHPPLLTPIHSRKINLSEITTSSNW